jgi:hypothetical protein
MVIFCGSLEIITNLKKNRIAQHFHVASSYATPFKGKIPNFKFSDFDLDRVTELGLISFI